MRALQEQEQRQREREQEIEAKLERQRQSAVSDQPRRPGPPERYIIIIDDEVQGC